MKRASLHLKSGMDFNGYQLLEQCGKPGGYGVVWKATPIKQESVDTVAIKIFNPDSEHGIEVDELKDRFIAGARTLSRFNNNPRYTVVVYEINEEYNPPYVVMEHVDGGHLIYNDELSVVERLSFVVRLVEAVAYLHKQQPRPIVHRDLKPENILLRRSKSNEEYPVLSDFDTVKEFDRYLVEDSICVPHSWQAPEIQIGVDGMPRCRHYTPLQDIYSLGMLTAYILTGNTPAALTREWRRLGLHKSSPHDQYAYYQTRLRTELDRLDVQGVNDVILKSVDENPDNRYDDASVFLHFLQESIGPLQVRTKVRKIKETDNSNQEISNTDKTDDKPPHISDTALQPCYDAVDIASILKESAYACSVCESVDGRWLITPLVNRIVHVWDTSDFNNHITIRPSMNEGYIVGCTMGNSLDEYEVMICLNTGYERWKLHAPDNSAFLIGAVPADNLVSSVYSHDYRHIMLVSISGHVELRNTVDNSIEAQIDINERLSTGIFINNDDQVVIGSETGKLYFWNPIENTFSVLPIGHQSSRITSLLYTPGNKRWVSTGEDGIALIHNVKTLDTPIVVDLKSPIISAAWSEKTGMVVVGLDNGHIVGRSMYSINSDKWCEGATSEIITMGAIGNRYVAVSTGNRFIDIRNIRTGQLLLSMAGFKDDWIVLTNDGRIAGHNIEKYLYSKVSGGSSNDKNVIALTSFQSQ